MRFSLYVRYMLMEFRGSAGRLTFFLLCLAIGVAAVVAVASLADSLEQGVRAEARQLLAADLVVAGRRPPPPELDRALARLAQAQRVDVQEMVTIVAAPSNDEKPGRSQLVELKVVDEPYPFYGRLDLHPPLPLAQLLKEDSTVVAPDLLPRLGLELGDSLLIGGVAFRIAGTVLAEPDRIASGMTLGPRLLLSHAGLARTGLRQLGSRVLYRVLVKVSEGTAPASEVDAAAEMLAAALPQPAYYRIETFTEAQPTLRRGLARLERFLGLVALLSLLVGGVGVAEAVRSWLASRRDAIAILKCLGVRPREILALYLGQTVLLGALGSLLGAAGGLAVQWVLPRILSDVVPAAWIRLWQPVALLQGGLVGMGVALLFSLPPLGAVFRVPPARVLRRDAELLPGNRWLSWATAASFLAGVCLLAVIQSRSLRLGVQFTVAVLATGLALLLAALIVTRLGGRLSRDWGRVWLRHGLASLSRPGAATLGAMVALGLGLLVVQALSLVQENLSRQLAAELPTQAPTAFLIDIQPDQWPGVEVVLREQGADLIESVPVVMARLAAVDGRTVGELADEDPDNRSRRWALTREQRLTYLSQLPEDNQIVQGALWSEPKLDEVSIEQDFAQELRAAIGSILEFDVQGIPLELTVTSIRRVDWESFGINFYLVVEPGALKGAPQLRVASARLPGGAEQSTQDALAAKFPNITLLRIREVLEKVVTVLQRLGWAVRFLGGFTVVAGLAILGGAVSAGSVRRGREVALLKTLGMTRREVIGVFATEYALVGLVAGIIGCCGGAALAWAVVSRALEVSWQLEPTTVLATISSGVALAVAAGVGASARALARRPVEILRDE